MNTKKLLLIAGGIFLILVILLVVFLSLFSNNTKPITLTYWGLWEPESVYQTVIADYQKLHPNVTIKYIKQSSTNYRDRVVTAITGNGGPDIVRIHNSWVPSLKTGLASVPASVYSLSSFKSTFYPVAVSDLTSQNQIYAIPLEIDNIQLYVNDDIFRAGGVSVPTIWDADEIGFLQVAKKLTVKDGSGKIKTSGAAMGTASNVDHWQEIVGLMMLQAGVNLNTQANSEAAVGALGFYTAFARQQIWNDTLDNSTLAFANGKVAMIFGPSWSYFDIKAINPNLNFHIAPVPQLTGGATINYGTYWVEAVSKKSGNQAAAFEFLKFLSSKDELAKLYQAEAKLRGFGEPYSRQDMATLLENDTNVGPFIKAAPTTKSWYLASWTGDGESGVNSRISKYYTDAINASIGGNGGTTTLDTVAKGITQILGER